jgi:hypothetical protein
MEVEDASAILKQLDERDWEFKGTIYKIVHQGEVPLFQGGSRSMKALGNLKISPAYSTDHVLIVPYRMVLPVSKFDPNQRSSAFRIQNHALIVNRSGTAAVKSMPWHSGFDDAGVASTWINSTFQFPLISKWPSDELEGATLHIFTNVPVASVNRALPPPER